MVCAYTIYAGMFEHVCEMQKKKKNKHICQLNIYDFNSITIQKISLAIIYNKIQALAHLDEHFDLCLR